MRTCLTITLLLWASLASQAQAAVNALPVRDAGGPAAAFCVGQGLAKPCAVALEQPLDYPLAACLLEAPAVAIAAVLPEPPTAPSLAQPSPRCPRAP
jgi:hypothetical protein